MPRPPSYYDQFTFLPIGFFVNGAEYTVTYTVDNGRGKVRNNLHYSENESAFVSMYGVENLSMFMIGGDDVIFANSKFYNVRCQIVSVEMRNTLENKVLKLKRGGGTRWPR